MTAFLGNTPKVLDNYLSRIWTGGAKLLCSASQYVFGLYQECEIFSKKWIGEASSLLTVNQSDYFLKEGVWNEKKLNTNRLNFVESMRQTRTKPDGILVLDDTGVKRYKKDDERGIAHQYSGELDGTGYCKIVVTSHYVDDTKDFPIGMESYYKGEETKITLAKNLIQQAVDQGIRFTYIAFDSWYLCKELTDYIESLGKIWISQPKDNRNVTLVSGEKMKVSSLVTTTSSESSHLIKGYLSDYGLVGFVKMKDGRVLATNAKEKEGAGIAKTMRKVYDKRFVIESFYREVKQQLHFRDFRVHDAVQVSRHWYLIFAAHTFATLARLKGWFGKIVDFAIEGVHSVVNALRALNRVQLTKIPTNVYMALQGVKVMN